MTKAELSSILKQIAVPVNEGITEIEKEKTFPRIDYWPFLWEDVMASGGDYTAKDTYQVSIYMRTPPLRSEENPVAKVKRILNDEGLYPAISHEFIAKDRIWHSYFAIEVDGDEQGI